MSYEEVTDVLKTPTLMSMMHGTMFTVLWVWSYYVLFFNFKFTTVQYWPVVGKRHFKFTKLFLNHPFPTARFYARAPPLSQVAVVRTNQETWEETKTG